MKQNGAGSQCVRRTNIGSLSFRERYLSLRKQNVTLLIIRGLLFFMQFLHQNYTQFCVGYTQFYTQVLFTFAKILTSRFAVSVKNLIS